jgi:hypothetical protein
MPKEARAAAAMTGVSALTSIPIVRDYSLGGLAARIAHHLTIRENRKESGLLVERVRES